MIDFRYHVVSIIAVFLALTIGLVIGATIVNQDAAKTLRAQITSANNDKAKLQQSGRSLAATNTQLGTYIDDTKNALVANQLTGDTVVVVRLPASNDGADKDTLALVKQAGATLAADVTVNPTFTDPSSTQQIADLLHNYTPAGQAVPGTGAAQAMNLLAEALTTAGPSSGPSGAPGAGPAPTPTATATATTSAGAATDDWAIRTIQAYADEGIITVNTMPTATTAKPDIALVAAPAAASEAQNPVYLALAAALRTGGAGPVVAGWPDSAGAGGLIAAVMKNSPAARTVSTVDDVGQTIGQVAVVFALYQAVAAPSANAGHYGTTGSTDGPLPKMPVLAAN